MTAGVADRPEPPGPTDASASALAAGLAAGNPAVVRVLVARDHAVAEFLAGSAAADSPGATVTRAWLALRADVSGGPTPADLRAALLGRVIDLLADGDLLDQSPADPVPAPGPFLTGDDPWAGWWADDGPVAWPDDAVPDPETVLRALRRLPLGPRVLLVLRDAAGLSPESVADLIGQDPYWQAVTLREARDGFVALLDRERAG